MTATPGHPGSYIVAYPPNLKDTSAGIDCTGEGCIRLSCALKEAAGPSNGDGLVHDPFPDAEILVDPLIGFLVIPSELFRFEAGYAASLA